MPRADRYIHRRGQARLQKMLLFLCALVVMAGLVGRQDRAGSMVVNTVNAPTATQVSSAFDETVESREVTLQAATWYALQTGLFTTPEAARQGAESYRDRGAPGLVVKEGDKYRVLIASYGQQTDAAAVRERLAREQQVETYLFAWTCPEVTLRLTGMAGQLDVVAAGLTLTEQTAAQLRDQAIALDAGGVTEAETAALLAEIDGQYQLWTDTARKRFARPYPGLLTQLMDEADHWRTAYDSLARAKNNGATAYSAALKTQAMSLYAQALGLRAAIGGG